MSLISNSPDYQLVFKNLTLKTREYTVFANINGKIGPKEMVAIIGPSGSGKTRLLNSLAGKVERGFSLYGEIIVNGLKTNIIDWPFVVGYVGQKFHAYGNYTVRETLLFYTKLKTGQCVDSSIDELIAILNLENVQNSTVGILSMGERKRLSVGVELIENPSILFLDEPTTSIDSFNAMNILSILKQLKKSGKSIIITIHQPSVEMLSYFDSLVLMGQGDVLFEGGFYDCISFFAENGFVCPCFTNPVDFFLETIGMDTTCEQSRNQSHLNLRKLQGAWKKKNKKYDINKIEATPQKKTTFNFFVFFALCNRNLRNHYRNKKYLFSLFLQQVSFTVLFGLAFLRLGYQQDDIQSRTGAVILLIRICISIITAPIYNIFPNEIKIIDWERKNSFYDGFSAYYAKYTAELFYALVFNLIYLSVVYWLIGFNDQSRRFFIFLLIMAVLICYSVAFGITVSVVSDSREIAQAIGSFLNLFYVLFGSAFSNPRTIKPWLKWLIWASPINYAYRAIMINTMKGLSFEPGVFGRFKTGEEVLGFFDLDTISLESCVFVLIGFVVFYSVLGAVVLHLTTRHVVPSVKNVV